MSSKVRTLEKSGKSGQKRQRVARAQIEGTPEEILTFEAQTLLSKVEAELLEPDGKLKPFSPLPFDTQLELEVVEQSSTGDGLAYSPDKNHVYAIPFCVPGDRVLAQTYKQIPHPTYTSLRFMELLRPSPKREGVTPGCKYFAECSGCQFQMISYEDQLKHKKTIVEKAFKNFSNLDPSLIPPVGDTIGSPLQYGYRTKLTPHYDGPRRKDTANWVGRPPPAIGFSAKNRHVVDIEHCPIGTPILNEGLTVERKKVHETYHTRKAGVTILLRESTKRVFKKESPSLEPPTSTTSPADGHPTTTPSATESTDGTEGSAAFSSTTTKPSTSVIPPSAEPSTVNNDFTAIPVPTPLSVKHELRAPDTPEIIYDYPTYRDIKTYTSVNQDFTTEYVGDFTFVSRANSFFQNNNSILPTFIKYVRDNCLPPPPPQSLSSSSSSSTAVQKPNGTQPQPQEPPIKYLLDAYCGSGLFAIGLSPLFSSVLGIDIDAHGIEAARQNAKINNIPNAGFIAADADVLFADVPFPPDQSLVVIDPPRKGASVDFLKQLCAFGPRRVVYVSCNVHTQARDVGMLVTGLGGKKWRYQIESLRGFDFFPQTGHVEGVCFLSRVPAASDAPDVDEA
ncbi:tRNA(m5U54)methyltransferase [Exophiala xenobiotica]|nr:tRNA(m5U54)methyltransferase [Exophiala xenobiotica]